MIKTHASPPRAIPQTFLHRKIGRGRELLLKGDLTCSNQQVCLRFRLQQLRQMHLFWVEIRSGGITFASSSRGLLYANFISLRDMQGILWRRSCLRRSLRPCLRRGNHNALLAGTVDERISARRWLHCFQDYGTDPRGRLLRDGDEVDHHPARVGGMAGRTYPEMKATGAPACRFRAVRGPFEAAGQPPGK